MDRFYSWFYSGWVRFRFGLGVPWRYFVRIVFFVAGFTLLTLRYYLRHDGRERTEGEEGSGRPEGLREDRVGKGAAGSEAGGVREGRVGKGAAGSEEQEEGEEEQEEGEEEQGVQEEEDEEYRVDSTDELFCGYDSTWEPEDQQDPPDRTGPTSRSRSFKFRRFENAARDMQNYRHHYPLRLRRWGNEEPNGKPNLQFYVGQSPSLPDGVYIEDFHNKWFGEYEALESVHTFIQWLFPLEEPGMNHQASVLTKAEIQEFCQNTTAKENLLKSYKLMLDFYGIELRDEETGEVQRASNWRDRFDNLNSHTHNNLRITRILKCLATLGYPHYQEPLVRFYLEETLVHGELANVKDSALNYFIFAVRDKKQRRKLLKFAYLNYDPRDEFVWCPKKVQMKWSGLSKSKHPKERTDTWGVSLHDSGPQWTPDKASPAKDQHSPSAVDVDRPCDAQGPPTVP